MCHEAIAHRVAPTGDSFVDRGFSANLQQSFGPNLLSSWQARNLRRKSSDLIHSVVFWVETDLNVAIGKFAFVYPNISSIHSLYCIWMAFPLVPHGFDGRKIKYRESANIASAIQEVCLNGRYVGFHEDYIQWVSHSLGVWFRTRGFSFLELKTNSNNCWLVRSLSPSAEKWRIDISSRFHDLAVLWAQCWMKNQG